MTELLTPKQKARKVRDNQVVAAYKAMREQYPTAAPSRIIAVLAEENTGGLTSYCGIRNVLIKAGQKLER